MARSKPKTRAATVRKRPTENDIDRLLGAGDELADAVLGIHGDPHHRALEWRDIAKTVSRRLTRGSKP